MSSKKDKNYQRAFQLTHVVLAPKNKIATFWATTFQYHVISQLLNKKCSLRSGTIDCYKPKIITPDSFMDTFHGFSKEDVEFAEHISGEDISRVRILGYQFRNQLQDEKKIFLPIKQVISNIKNRSKEKLDNTVILAAPDDIWSLSLTKFAMETIFRSFPGNIQDLEERGFFLSESEKRVQEIEMMFMDVNRSSNKELAKKLGSKLQQYGLFDKYEERFLNLYKSLN